MNAPTGLTGRGVLASWAPEAGDRFVMTSGGVE